VIDIWRRSKLFSEDYLSSLVQSIDKMIELENKDKIPHHSDSSASKKKFKNHLYPEDFKEATLTLNFLNFADAGLHFTTPWVALADNLSFAHERSSEHREIES
jgi:hypothetical protein